MHDQQSIRIEGVASHVHVGVGDAERAAPQTVRVTVTLHVFDPPAFDAHDALSATIDYDLIIAFIRDGLPKSGPAHLIETLADRVATAALGLSPRIASAEVTVEKPAVLGADGVVSVTLVRQADRATHRHALFLAEENRREEARR